MKLLHTIDFDVTAQEDEDNHVYIEDCADPDVIRSTSILKDLISEIQFEEVKSRTEKQHQRKKHRSGKKPKETVKSENKTRRS